MLDSSGFGTVHLTRTINCITSDIFPRTNQFTLQTLKTNASNFACSIFPLFCFAPSPNSLQ